MRLVALAVVAAFAVGTVSIADAAPRKKEVAYVQPGPGSTVITSQDERGRVRTKILVQKRSYLDGGTEVMPGDIQSHQTNFIDMQQNPRSAVSNQRPAPPWPDCREPPPSPASRSGRLVGRCWSDHPCRKATSFHKCGYVVRRIERRGARRHY